MRPRGPPRTSAPTNTAHHMTRNAAHSRHAQDRAHHVARRAVYMVGADVPGRPPPVRTGTTPVDDASTRAAEDVGPYQRRTAVACRAAHTSCGAQGRIHGRGGRPRPPAPARTRTTPVDDTSARAAEDVGPYQRRTSHDTQRRALTARAEPHTSCGAQGRIHMVGADVPGRPPPVRTGTTPVDDASARAAEDVGPYQHRTAVVCRAAHTSCGAQNDDAHDTLTDAGSLRPSDD